MPGIVREAARFVDALAEEDKEFSYIFIQKLILAWDPDFTKVTAEEAEKIRKAKESGYVDAEDLDWENIGIDE